MARPKRRHPATRVAKRPTKAAAKKKSRKKKSSVTPMEALYNVAREDLKVIKDAVLEILEHVRAVKAEEAPEKGRAGASADSLAAAPADLD